MRTFGLSGLFLILFFTVLPVTAQNSSDILPEGKGKGLVEFACSQCHGLNRITRSPGYNSAEEWRALFSTMIKLADVQAVTVAEYLATHFLRNRASAPT